MKRVLIVDDDPNVLVVLEAMLEELTTDWVTEFVSNPETVFSLVETTPYDAIICDIRMPRISGDQVLRVVREKSPRTARIAMSGFADRRMMAALSGIAQIFVLKPSPFQLLRDTISSALRLREIVFSPSIDELWSLLPVTPAPPCYRDLVEVLRSDEPSIQAIGEIIRKDPLLTEDVLSRINSSALGLHGRLDSPAEAVIYAGADLLKALVLESALFAGSHLPEVRKECRAVATAARRIARAENMRSDLSEVVFTAGLLHRASELLCNDREVRTESINEANRAALSARLAMSWGLPDSVSETIAFSNSPKTLGARGVTATAIIHASIYFAREKDGGPPGTTLELEQLGLADRGDRWRAIAKSAYADIQ